MKQNNSKFIIINLLFENLFNSTLKIYDHIVDFFFFLNKK